MCKGCSLLVGIASRVPADKLAAVSQHSHHIFPLSCIRADVTRPPNEMTKFRLESDLRRRQQNDSALRLVKIVVQRRDNWCVIQFGDGASMLSCIGVESSMKISQASSAFFNYRYDDAHLPPQKALTRQKRDKPNHLLGGMTLLAFVRY